MKIFKFVAVLPVLLLAFDPMLVNKYKGDENLSGWVMSEKLQGVRGLWDGKTLKNRAGNIIPAPDFFTKCYPDFAIDGEIYSYKLPYEDITAATKGQNPNAWIKIKHYIFDVPEAEGGLMQRLAVLQEYLDKNKCDTIKIIPQLPAISHKNMENYYNEIVTRNGQGVIVRDPNAPYKGGRSNKILKFKKQLDDECKILDYNNGTGKFSSTIISLTCKNLKDDKIFKIKSGIDKKVRNNPPKKGTIITYKYHGIKDDGSPKNPVFLYAREDLSEVNYK